MFENVFGNIWYINKRHDYEQNKMQASSDSNATQLLALQTSVNELKTILTNLVKEFHEFKVNLAAEIVKIKIDVSAIRYLG